MNRFVLAPRSSMDLLSGWDVDTAEHRRLAIKIVCEEKPYVSIGSPPCTLFGTLLELAKAANKDDPDWIQKHNEAVEAAVRHVEFCCGLYRWQLSRGKHFVHEHPWAAKSRKFDCVGTSWLTLT